MSKYVRLNLSLAQELKATVDDLQARMGLGSTAELFRNALAIIDVVVNELEKNPDAKLIIQAPDQEDIHLRVPFRIMR